jgi:hypothetical protein
MLQWLSRGLAAYSCGGSRGIELALTAFPFSSLSGTDDAPTIAATVLTARWRDFAIDNSRNATIKSLVFDGLSRESEQGMRCGT